MDVVLEVLDTYVFDRMYATALPLQHSALTSSPLDGLAPNPNSTWAALEHQSIQNFKFQPASQFFHVEPSQYAYMSQLPRDNAVRQAFSLFLTTWYASQRTQLFRERC